RKELERESKKWLLETKIVDSSGSELSRHGYSPQKSDWSALDFFLSVGVLSNSKAEVERGVTISDHWPLSLKCPLTAAAEPKEEVKKLSRMGIRNKTDELAHHRLWEETNPSLESLLSNISVIASEQSLWCKQGGRKRLALRGGTKAILKRLRELKGKAVVNGPLSEEEAAELARIKTEARRKCRNETKARQDKLKAKIAADVLKGDTRAIWRLAKPQNKRRPGLTPILDENNTLQTGEEEIDRTWRDHWA
ncbi:MAG: uncharacterized protein A8A55_3429, partial [Amphiamblys sp. WSBS2006]